MSIQSINPATEVVEKSFPSMSDHDIEAAIELAASVFNKNRLLSVNERVAWVREVAVQLRADKHIFAEMMTNEMGKTLTASEAEVEKCAWLCDYYSEHMVDMLKPNPIETNAQVSEVRYQPLGTILAVMPWNYPFWQVFRFAIPALLAGNAGLLKHASNVPACAQAIQNIFESSGVPKGLFQTLLIDSNKVEGILNNAHVKAATLTGSEGAGRKVAETAGKNLKKMVLELGGSDAFIVMPSADLELAIEKAVKGRTQNNGQSCIAAKRFIVHESIYNSFKKRLKEKFESLVIGNPLLRTTDIGPLANKAIMDELDKQVEDTLSSGATRVTGAHTIDRIGWYYQPGIIENIPKESPAYSEELFGPVACMFKVENLDEAITLANDTRFGLSSAIFTKDKHEIEKAFNQIQAGATFVNTITASDPRLPFGGIKASGYGRELSKEGVLEFMNIKTCCIGETT